MKIGILGGGQLGMMMVEGTTVENLSFLGLDPSKDCPLSFVCKDMIVADYNDITKFEKLVDKTDKVTYEFENVDFELVEKHEDKFPQKLKALKKSRDRFIEKAYASSLELKTPMFKEYNSFLAFEYPCIIKTRTGGYDGKGQVVCKTRNEFDQFSARVEEKYILEEMISFDYEISVVASRDEFGNVETYPITRNEHRNGILHISTVIEVQDSKCLNIARENTTKIINDLDYVGTLAVEYFIKGEEVIFNEYAPRPHNSGHYTIEGCNVSQFTNHVRAISGLEIEKVKLVKPTAMVNILGQHMTLLEKIKEYGFVHLYHKQEAKMNRKMGHITIQKSTYKELNEIIKLIDEVLS